MKVVRAVFVLCILSLGCGPTAPTPDAGPLTVLSEAATVTVKASAQDGEAIDRASGTRTVRLDIAVANTGSPAALGVDPEDFFVVTDNKLEVTPTGCGPAVRVAQGGQFECRLTVTLPWTHKATELVYAPRQSSVEGQALRVPLAVAECTVCGSVCRADRHACPATFLELGPATPASFAYTDTHVYWAEFTTGDVMQHKLDAAPGEQPTRLAQDRNGGAIALGQDSLVWVTDHLSPSTTLKKAPLAGGTPVALFDNSAITGLEAIASVAVRGDDVFFVAFIGPNAEAWKVPLAGGSPTKFMALESPHDTFVADGTHAYWVTAAGVLKRAPLAGGAATVLVAADVDSVPPAVNGSHVVYVSYDRAARRASLSAVPLTGGAPRLLADAGGDVNGLAVDAQHVYWAVFGNAGRVLKVPLAGDEAPLLVGGSPFPNPGMLHLVGSRLFWAASTGDVAPLSLVPPKFITSLARTF